MMENKQFQAVIFDMDGVLVDSEPYFVKRTDEFYQSHGVTLPKEALDLTVGSNIRRNWETLMHYSTKKWTLEDYIREFRAYSNERMIPYGECLNETAVETLEALKANGYRVALASSTSMEGIERMLSECGLHGYFEEVLSGGMFKESKPNPEIYLKMAELLGLPPAACAAVEDSSYGITAGVSAGMTVIAKRDERFGVDQSAAHYKIDRLIELLPIVGCKAAGVR